MKQIALDIGLTTGPTLDSYFAGPNKAALDHLASWVSEQSNAPVRSPVPTYVWGASGSGKTHLLKAAREALQQRAAAVADCRAERNGTQPDLFSRPTQGT